MKVEDCIRELKLHGLLEAAGEIEGEPAFVITDEALKLLTAHAIARQQDFPTASLEQIRTQALIMTVLKMGLVCGDSLFDYCNTLDHFAGAWVDALRSQNGLNVTGEP